MRTGHLAFKLGDCGHQVTWWASLFNHYTKDWEDFGADNSVQIRENVVIRALKGIGYSHNVSIRRFVDHMIVARHFEKIAANEPKPDLIVAALPDHRLAYAAFRYARKNGIPFVIDLGDRWPWDLVKLLPTPLQWIGKLALANDFRIAKRVLRQADSVVTMMTSWDPWLRQVVGRQQNDMDRVYFLGAPKLKSNPQSVRQDVAKLIAENCENWNILFIGAFNKNYWPKIVIDICRNLRQHFGEKLEVKPGQQIRFMLAGDGDYMQDLRDLVGDDPAYILPGYVNDAEIYELMAHSKVGLVTANGDFHAFPNNVFTYMSGGLPIISNLGYEFAEMITDEKIGIFCKDAKESAKEIQVFAEDENKRKSYSERCRIEFETKHDSEHIYESYSKHLEHLVAQRGR